MPKQQVGSRPAQRVQGHAGKLLIYTNVIERTMSTDRRIDALHARHSCWSVFFGGVAVRLHSATVWTCTAGRYHVL